LRREGGGGREVGTGYRARTNDGWGDDGVCGCFYIVMCIQKKHACPGSYKNDFLSVQPQPSSGGGDPDLSAQACKKQGQSP